MIYLATTNISNEEFASVNPRAFLRTLESQYVAELKDLVATVNKLKYKHRDLYSLELLDASTIWFSDDDDNDEFVQMLQRQPCLNVPGRALGDLGDGEALPLAEFGLIELPEHLVDDAYDSCKLNEFDCRTTIILTDGLIQFTANEYVAPHKFSTSTISTSVLWKQLEALSLSKAPVKKKRKS